MVSWGDGSSEALRKCSSNSHSFFSPPSFSKENKQFLSALVQRGGSNQLGVGGRVSRSDSFAPLSNPATSPSFSQIEMKQCGRKQKGKSIRFSNKKKHSAPRQASGSERSDPCPVPRAQHVSAIPFFSFLFQWSTEDSQLGL